MLVVALVGIRSGKSTHEIAVELYGMERVADGLDRDGGMLARVRRLGHWARFASGAWAPVERGAMPRTTVRQ